LTASPFIGNTRAAQLGVDIRVISSLYLEPSSEIDATSLVIGPSWEVVGVLEPRNTVAGRRFGYEGTDIGAIESRKLLSFRWSSARKSNIDSPDAEVRSMLICVGRELDSQVT
jgi:hypothetical protein